MTPYTYSSFVPFQYADSAGIVFFGHAFSIIHQALEQWVIYYLDCPWEEWFNNPEWIVPIKETHAIYSHPLRAGQDCQVNISLKSSSSTAFTLTFEIFQSGVVCCVINLTQVFCSRSTHKKIPIPVRFGIILSNHFQTSAST